MTVQLVSDQKIAETSSKGNQEKWQDGNIWYKLDQFGYEALAEVFTSQLLEYSNGVYETHQISNRRRHPTMIFLCYPKCTTCQKAQKWLDAKGIPYAPRHIKEQNPTVAELRQWHQKSGLPLKKFFNTSGLLYKEKHLRAAHCTISHS